MRTVKGEIMNGARLWLLAAALQATVLVVTAVGHHRRSMQQQVGFPSKGGWRPVLGSGGLVYGSFGTAPLHAPYQVPVLDNYGSSSRPHVTRDVTKLTSIAQSYRPTTHRSISSNAPQALPQSNQPINSYHNPYTYNNVNGNNGVTHYKYIQNYPVESVLIRNPHNSYAARPVYQKYQNKVNKPNLAHQQLSNIQPIHFGQYQTNKPLDVFGKQDVFGRPSETKKPTSASTEIFKPDVYKLPDNDAAQQSLNQQIKTAQQTYNGLQKKPISPYANYAFQDSVFPPSILGTFNSFGVQSVKGRDPVYPSTKTTYIPSQPTKQTIFNSFSYSPYFKATQSQFPNTTPKLQSTANHIHFGTSLNDYKHIPTQQTKLSTAPKQDPNAGTRIAFKASPQDPFAKPYQNGNQNSPITVTTYNPTVATTTLANNNYYQDYSVQHNKNAQSNYYNQQNVNNNYEKKKNKIHDSLAAGLNQQNTQQYALPPDDKFQIEATPDSVPFRATYEVTEHYDADDIVTHSSPAAWSVSPNSYDRNKQRFTEEPVIKQEFSTAFGIPSTTHVTDLPEELAIVTEGEKGYENSLSYDNQVESQSRRPLGDDFEPIGKHKLKEYYYKVSTPAYEEHHTRRTKKPSQTTRLTTPQAVTTPFGINQENNDIPIETLPTLPPNRHFKRPVPNAPDAMDKDKIRKRNKNRRRRPPLANITRDKEETSTRRAASTTETTYTTETEDHTFKPRVRASKPKQPTVTTPTTTNDLTTSGVPTSSPTTPTVSKKKIGQRRPSTSTTDKAETTTQYTNQDGKDSPIMKISNRPHGKPTSTPYEYKTSETPDYTHKQDEKDTPTSDTDVIPDNLRTTKSDGKAFSFHRDMRPVDQKETTTDTTKFIEDVTNSITETTIRVEPSSESSIKIQRTRIKNKYDSNRPRFSVKDYRNRLSSTTSTTEKTVEAHAPKLRFPQRRLPYNENKFNTESDNSTERKKFTPKEPRHKGLNGTEMDEQTEREIHAIRQPNKHRHNTVETTELSTPKISARVRNGSRRKTTTTEEPPTTSVHKRPLRKKVKDTEIGESVQDITIMETTANYGNREETSERTRSESAIMKIADKKQKDHVEHLFEHSKRVSDLTLAASKDYNTPGMFKTVASNSRRIPNYFTIATDDPILPIEAFFPQLNQRKEA